MTNAIAVVVVAGRRLSNVCAMVRVRWHHGGGPPVVRRVCDWRARDGAEIVASEVREMTRRIRIGSLNNESDRHVR